MYVCMYVCIHTYICMHIYIHTSALHADGWGGAYPQGREGGAGCRRNHQNDSQGGPILQIEESVRGNCRKYELWKDVWTHDYCGRFVFLSVFVTVFRLGVCLSVWLTDWLYLLEKNVPWIHGVRRSLLHGMHACIHTYIHTYILIDTNIQLNTYINTYIHTYIHTYSLEKTATHPTHTSWSKRSVPPQRDKKRSPNLNRPHPRRLDTWVYAFARFMLAISIFMHVICEISPSATARWTYACVHIHVFKCGIINAHIHAFTHADVRFHKI